MNIEHIFAAAVFNAERDAADCCAQGIFQTAADRVSIALVGLWGCGPVFELSDDEIYEIACRHVEWDENEDPWPLPFDRGKIIILK
jgi:hypothetical protein